MQFKKNLKNQKGQGLIEYVIIVAIVAVGAISLVRVLHQSINVQFASIAKALGARSSARLSAPEITSSMVQKKDLSNFMRGSKGGHSNDETDDASSTP